MIAGVEACGVVNAAGGVLVIEDGTTSGTVVLGNDSKDTEADGGTTTELELIVAVFEVVTRTVGVRTFEPAEVGTTTEMLELTMGKPEAGGLDADGEASI